jgi:hypothetical protein
MLRTKNISSDVYGVPDTWIFEHYIRLPERLTGQDINIKSIFSAQDKNPSLFIYYSRNLQKYKFKDFSADKQGDGIELVKELFNIPNRFEAAAKITKDYNDYMSSGKSYVPINIEPESKFKLHTFQLKNWMESDERYWKRFHIGFDILKFFNVQPLESFTLRREGETEDVVIKTNRIYGFFKKDGTLYKIYQPLRKNGKFFKVQSHVQGLEQLTFKKPYLVIGSSLKDIAAFTRLGFVNAEVIAPDSENVMVPAVLIQELKPKYKAICTLFDNDEAGIKAMIKYKEEYDLPGAHLKVEKDLADCIETHGVEHTREFLYPVLTKALTGTAKELP